MLSSQSNLEGCKSTGQDSLKSLTSQFYSICTCKPSFTSCIIVTVFPPIGRSIMRACANLGVVDSRVVDAVQVRQELDLRIGEPVRSRGVRIVQSTHTLVGCAFTRFQTRRMTKAFPSVLSDQLISYGPCQFPTLGFVVERVSALFGLSVCCSYSKYRLFLSVQRSASLYSRDLFQD